MARFSGERKVTEHKMCVSIFCTNLSETFLGLRITERDMIKNVQGGPKVVIQYIVYSIVMIVLLKY